MRINRTCGALIGITLLLLVLNACQMQTLYSGTMGCTKLQINLPRSLSANAVTNQSTSGSASRLVLSNSGFLEVIVRQDGMIVTIQKYKIASGAKSIPVSLNLNLGKDYVIEVNAYIAEGGTLVCQGFINYNSTKNGAIASCSLVPYSKTPWTILTSSNKTFNLSSIDPNESYTMQVNLTGTKGITIPTFGGIETFIQDNDGTLIAEIKAKGIDGEYTVIPSNLHNPNLPFFLTYYNVGSAFSGYGNSTIFIF